MGISTTVPSTGTNPPDFSHQPQLPSASITPRGAPAVSHHEGLAASRGSPWALQKGKPPRVFGEIFWGHFLRHKNKDVWCISMYHIWSHIWKNCWGDMWSKYDMRGIPRMGKGDDLTCFFVQSRNMKEASCGESSLGKPSWSVFFHHLIMTAIWKNQRSKFIKIGGKESHQVSGWTWKINETTIFIFPLVRKFKPYLAEFSPKRGTYTFFMSVDI